MLARGIGVRRSPRHVLTTIGLGVRELTAGVGLLATERPVPWLWARVVGDALDLALLGVTLASRHTDQARAAGATAAVAGVTALDVWTALELGGVTKERLREVHVTRTTTVNRPADEVYRFWRDFENLPRFMAHLASVRILDDRRSRWSATAPAGTTVEWEAEIVDDRPNELIAWRSTGGVENSGTVHFAPAPGGRGTELRVEMTYAPPGGVLGAAVARLLGEEPAGQIEGDLRRFKQVMEVGEVVHSDSSIHRGMHPARPSAR
jgi:uncharacterized membrane protein